MYKGFELKHFVYFDELERNNSRAFWDSNKEFYHNEIRYNFESLAKEYAPMLGEAKIYRPWRDIRFAKDKRPLKSEQSIFWSGLNWGFYLELSRLGVRTGFGYRPAMASELLAFRKLVASQESGVILADEISHLEQDGWSVVGSTLKTAPRGYSSKHPRIRLLRFKEIGIEQLLSREEHIALKDPASHLRMQLDALIGVSSWFMSHASVLGSV